METLCVYLEKWQCAIGCYGSDFDQIDVYMGDECPYVIEDRLHDCPCYATGNDVIGILKRNESTVAVSA